jgi:hypothetical protein
LLLVGWTLRLTLGLASALSIPAPDRPVMRSAVLLAFEVEARNRAEDFLPIVGVATNLDLRLDGFERIESLIEQVAHDASLWLIASRTDITNGQVVVHAHMAFDKTRHLPVVCGAVVALEDEDVAAAGGTPITFAAALVIGMREGGADGIAQCRGVVRLGGPNAIRQTSFFHGASCRTA